MKIQPAMAGLEDREKGLQAKEYKLPLETENNLWSTASEEISQQLTKNKNKTKKQGPQSYNYITYYRVLTTI